MEEIHTIEALGNMVFPGIISAITGSLVDQNKLLLIDDFLLTVSAISGVIFVYHVLMWKGIF